MKTGRIFWATLFIMIGVLGFLDNIGWLALDWHFWRNFWPLVLIFLGGAVLLRNNQWRWIAVAGTAVFTAVIIFSLFMRASDEVRGLGNVHIGSHRSHSRDAVTQFMTENYDAKMNRAALHFESGAGHFSIGDTTSSMLAVKTQSTIGPYLLTREDEAGVPTYKVAPEDGNISWEGGRHENVVDMRLHADPEWDIDLDIGAASADLDLRSYKVREVSVDAGASSIQVTLGDRSPVAHVTVDAGASSITIRVPKNAICTIHLDTGLTHKDLRGFTETEEGVWTCTGSGANPPRISVDLETGVASVVVERY